MYSDTALSNTVRNLKAGNNNSMQFVLNATVAGVLYVKSFTLPDTASVARVYSNFATRVALNEQPVAASTTSFVVGAMLVANEWATFALENGLSRTLQVASLSTATVFVEIE